MTRFLAMLCGICPVCAASRMWPRSAIRRWVALYERFCPACRAHRSLSDQGGGEEMGSKLIDGVVMMAWAAVAAAGTVTLILLMSR